MKKNFFSILILSTFLLFSCSNDDDNPYPLPMQNNCESVGLKMYTECCIEGPIQAKSDQIISLTYTSNFVCDMYDWEVLGSSMTLVEGQNAATAKFRTSKNFVRDSIVGYSRDRNMEQGCSNIIVIEAY